VFDFVDDSATGVIRPEFVAAVEVGARDCLQVGSLAGYEMLNVRATLLGGKEHDHDSSELAFENAARIAFDQAVKNAGPVILEPIMKLEVTVPDEYFGVVSGDLSARRGIIEDTELRQHHRVIHAHVPLAEMFQYATKLRTLTQGRSSWSMEPASYEPMPPNLQLALLRRYGYVD